MYVRKLWGIICVPSSKRHDTYTTFTPFLITANHNISVHVYICTYISAYVFAPVYLVLT